MMVAMSSALGGTGSAGFLSPMAKNSSHAYSFTPYPCQQRVLCPAHNHAVDLTALLTNIVRASQCATQVQTLNKPVPSPMKSSCLSGFRY